MVRWRLLGLVVFSLTVCACGGSDDGSFRRVLDDDDLQNNSGPFTVSGTIQITAGTQTDTDTNDSFSLPEANDSPENAQALPSPVTVGGYVNVAGSGPSGRSQTAGDSIDYYRASLVPGQMAQLRSSNCSANLDLSLYTNDGTTLIDASTSSNGSEAVTLPQDAESGNYILAVEAVSDSSNYLLKVDTANFDLGDNCDNTMAQTHATEADFRPGEILVKYKPQAADQVSPAQALPLNLNRSSPDGVHIYDLGSTPQREDALRALGVPTKVSALTASDTEQLKQQTLAVVEQLNQRSDIEYAEPNYIFKAYFTPDDQFYQLQWHYPLINLPSAWDKTPGGSPDVIVAVIDTGIKAQHPDFDCPNKLVDGYDLVSSATLSGDGDGIDPDPEDPGNDGPASQQVFHGSHVAGTIAACTNNGIGVAGVAGQVRLMPLRALAVGDDSEYKGTLYDVAQSIRYAAGLSNDSGTVPDTRADIINMSLGTDVNPQSLQAAIADALNQGVVLVAAAGNASVDQPSYPAASSGVFSVSATNIKGELASYSNFGDTIDIAAPGGDATTNDLNGDGFYDEVLSTGGVNSDIRYTFMRGTSMASPHVAGVFALMASVIKDKGTNDAFNFQRLQTALEAGELTLDIGDPGRDNAFGYGLIDANKAVNMALNDGGVNSPFLAASPTQLNFGSNLTSTNLFVFNAGSGDLQITNVSADPPWLDVEPPANSDVGTYTVTVDRSGLSEGTHSGNITLASPERTITVMVTVQVVLQTFNENAGDHYVLLVEPGKEYGEGEFPKQVRVTAQDGQYRFELTDVPAGEYQLVAGSDLNNDNRICDTRDFEACGGYSTLADLEIIQVDRDISDLNFFTSYNIGLTGNISSDSHHSQQKGWPLQPEPTQTSQRMD